MVSLWPAGGAGQHPGLEGRRQLGPEGAGIIMQINANEHLPGAGTAWAQSCSRHLLELWRPR